MLFMGKSTMSMVIFNSYVKLPEGTENHLMDCNFSTWDNPLASRIGHAEKNVCLVS